MHTYKIKLDLERYFPWVRKGLMCMSQRIIGSNTLVQGALPAILRYLKFPSSPMLFSLGEFFRSNWLFMKNYIGIRKVSLFDKSFFSRFFKLMICSFVYNQFTCQLSCCNIISTFTGRLPKPFLRRRSPSWSRTPRWPSPSWRRCPALCRSCHRGPCTWWSRWGRTQTEKFNILQHGLKRRGWKND